jgi:hypothetical protein
VLTTDARGSAQLVFTPSHGGEYQLELQGRDARGKVVSGGTWLWVSASDETVGWPFAPYEADDAPGVWVGVVLIPRNPSGPSFRMGYVELNVGSPALSFGVTTAQSLTLFPSVVAP